MSTNMQALLERISTKPVVLPATYEPPEISNALRYLWSQVETQQWKKFMLEQLVFEIMGLDAEITEYQYYKKDKTCLIELQLGVERYGGTRGPWCINYQMEEYRQDSVEAGDPDPYPDCPKAEDYEIGYYAHSSKDTIRFIKDRLAWAIKFTEKRFKAACKLVKVLESWDARKGIPEVSWIAGMIDGLAGNPTFFGVNYADNKKSIYLRTVFPSISENGHKLAIEAVTNLKTGELLVRAFRREYLKKYEKGTLSEVNTGIYHFKFYAKHLSFSYNPDGTYNHPDHFSLDIKEKFYSTSEHSTKISFFTPEFKEDKPGVNSWNQKVDHKKTDAEKDRRQKKIDAFLEKLMKDADMKIEPRFSLEKYSKH